MFQDGPVDGDLNIIIDQSQGKVEKGRHLIDDGKKHGERSAKGEVNACKEEDEFPMAGYPFHSTPIKRDEKQFSGEIPKWRTVLISRSDFSLIT